MTAKAAETGPAPADVLAEIDAAIEEHAGWLQRWHRALVCRESLPQEVASPNAQYLCRFGAWYDRHRRAPLVDQPAFQALAEAHRRLHEQSASLALAAAGGRAVPSGDYDRLIADAQAFNAQARRIVEAFRRLEVDVDPLTGVQNRHAMLAELERERARAQRGGAPLCIAIADLDRFKRVNDELGHAAGDRVLRATAGRLAAHLRPYDFVFRYGGEEFLLCMPNADEATAQAICERLRQAVAEAPIEIDGGPRVTVTVSFGLARLAAEGTVKDTLEAADRALYAAKAEGRNRVVVAA